MHILFLFIDGIGLGADDASNPFARHELPAFEHLSDGNRWLRTAAIVEEDRRLFRAIDPRLDMEGLPQSGTGQATLFTGVNCARVAGRHYGPYPHSETRGVIAEQNIFRQIESMNPADREPAAFANAYPDRFFEYVKKTDRWTVTTRCCLESHVRIRGESDLAEGLAIPADFTGRKWPDPIRNGLMPADEHAAAERLRRISSNHQFTLFEYYLSDKAGHKQSDTWAEEVLRSLDAFLAGLIESADRDEVLLILTSDHGNLEDLSTKTHTLHDVPFAAYGRSADRLNTIRRLEDVTPAIVSLLSVGK